MRRTIALILFVCALAACVLTPPAHAAPAAAKRAAARDLAAEFRHDLQAADRLPELSPIVSSTYVLLDSLEDALRNKDAEAMRAAVEQFADDARFLQAEAINPECLLPLVLSLNGYLSSMQGIVSSGGTPLCVFINLSNVLADLLSSIAGYQICVIENDDTPDNATDNATLEELEQQQYRYSIYGFAASVMNLIFCKRPIEVTDITALLIELVRLLPDQT